ncbi:O-methyltransferase, family 2 [Metarhizium album ARSEF 1941]|uniref:O-methyltransferase, family 2 n=1 Tax=Metarhizium album (strain ARSEF 1941) TaxID=1081103 RepID=A0A0B2WPI0_METAS|nr:O-methyltransferase, family 2 [Metarhizium album ARSEF 1941]KHN95923.1 O-methyltransferase, family 2 [Metarhizium album ARSEF 1941]
MGSMGNSLCRPQGKPSVDRLTTISRSIQENTQILTDKLHTQGLNAPSYEPHGLADFPLKESDDETLRARQQILSLTKELRDLVLGPREALKLMALDVVNYIPLHAIYTFKIAEAVPRQGSISYDNLTREVHRVSGFNIPASELRRLLRLAMANNLFCEPELGHVAHNRTSLVMLEDETLASWVGLYTVDLFLPVGNTVAAMQKWPGSQDLTETAVNISYGHNNTFFNHVQTDTTRAKRYDLAMRAHGSREGFDVSHTVQSYPWAKLGNATVVDVRSAAAAAAKAPLLPPPLLLLQRFVEVMGGNEGYVSMAIAESFPNLRFEVQDLPGMRTEATIGKVPPHLVDRVKLTTHDFFNDQPTVAGAYLFRHIFHAFPDRDVVRALRALIPAMRHGSRVILNDVVLPAPGAVSLTEEKTFRLLDVLMKTVCNGREREICDWKLLFEEADTRFVWQGAWKSSGNLWFVEAQWHDKTEVNGDNARPLPSVPAQGKMWTASAK